MKFFCLKKKICKKCSTFRSILLVEIFLKSDTTLICIFSTNSSMTIETNGEKRDMVRTWLLFFKTIIENYFLKTRITPNDIFLNCF